MPSISVPKSAGLSWSSAVSCCSQPSMSHLSGSPVCRTQNAANQPESRKSNAAARKVLVRIARDKAASELGQALQDLALERAMMSELRTSLQSSETALAQLRQENRNLSAELKQLRAADIPNLLHSIALVIELHARVVCNSCSRLADPLRQTPSPASPLHHGAELSPLALGWSSPASHDSGTDCSRALSAEFHFYLPLEEDSRRDRWPGSPADSLPAEAD